MSFDHPPSALKTCPPPRERLTAEQERDLARAIAGGDRDAGDRLVAANLGLVVVIARQFLGGGRDLDDLIADGTLGLIRACAEFDPDFGTRFGTYAAHWIREAIRKAIMNHGGLVRVPAYMTQRLREWRRAERQSEAGGGRTPGFEEVAGRLGLGGEQRGMVRQALRALRFRAEGDVAGEQGRGFEQMAAGCEGPGAAMERRDEVRVLRERMARRLDERERTVLALRFGLEDAPPLTMQEVGDRIGVTRKDARKIEAGAVAKLRRTGDPAAPGLPRRIIFR